MQRLLYDLYDHLRAITVRAALGVGVGAGCGLLGTLFLVLLDRAEATRAAYPQLLYLLPALGVCLGAIYARFGRSVEGGNNLVIDALCDGGPALPQRMVPMGLLGTTAIHLFGGSVGQEGTAMQLGAAFADGVHERLALPTGLRQACLAAGIAGGFSSVFGTPAAAAVFALEFGVAGQITTALLPTVVVAALVGDGVATALGIVRPDYPIPEVMPLTFGTAAQWLVFAAALSGAATLFVQLTDVIRKLAKHHVPSLPHRMLAGGTAVILFTLMVQTDIYLGGGMAYAIKALHGGPIPDGAWLLKLMLTALCLGTGFGGGEVTPLFFMGATLGHVLAPLLHLPATTGAAVGMAAILSSSTKAPLAWVLLIIELMGAQLMPHALLTCTFAAWISGSHRIYASQRGHS
jgi:H+/Cl- antiporter ClcA